MSLAGARRPQAYPGEAVDLRPIAEILKQLEAHEVQSARVLNMVPSENSMSALAKLPMMLDLYHRYFFNDGSPDDPWEFRGVEELAWLEIDLARSLLCELTGAKFVNLRPLSGLHLMTITLAALGGPVGSTVMLLSRAQGGHYASASIAARLGFEVCYLTGSDAHTVDEDQMAETLRAQRPNLIYIDQSNCLFPLDIERLARVAERAAPEAILHVDASHWMGLILGKQLKNPLIAGAHSFGGSTHKTFPGPQKAFFATNSPELIDRFRATLQYMVSSHHFGATLALAIALLEFKQCGGERYAMRIVQNTRALGAALDQRGMQVEGKARGFSGGHQLWIRTQPAGVDAFLASQRLFHAGIRTNAYPSLPGIPEPVLRVGVNEPTYHGLEPDDMDELADIFVSAVHETRPASALAARSAALRARYKLAYRFPSDNPALLEQALELVRLALTQSSGKADPSP